MTATSPSDPLLSVPKFAERIGVSPYTVRKWIKSGRLSAVNINIGGQLPVYRIAESQIEEIVKRIGCQGATEQADPQSH
jgi:excisionase family DNA binding protein